MPIVRPCRAADRNTPRIGCDTIHNANSRDAGFSDRCHGCSFTSPAIEHHGLTWCRRRSSENGDFASGDVAGDVLASVVVSPLAAARLVVIIMFVVVVAAGSEVTPVAGLAAAVCAVAVIPTIEEAAVAP